MRSGQVLRAANEGVMSQAGISAIVVGSALFFLGNVVGFESVLGLRLVNLPTGMLGSVLFLSGVILYVGDKVVSQHNEERDRKIELQTLILAVFFSWVAIPAVELINDFTHTASPKEAELDRLQELESQGIITPEEHAEVLKLLEDYDVHLKKVGKNGEQTGKDGAKGTAAGPVTAQTKPEQAPFAVTLVKKGFRPLNIKANGSEIEEPAITFQLSIRNLTGKDVRAFDGTLTFTDLLNNEIMSASLAINEVVGVDSILSWSGGIKYNQFRDRHQRLRSEPQDNLKINFNTKKVLFVGGTTKEYK